MEDYNKSGAMPGVTFVVEVGDDIADLATAATVAQKFVEDPAVVAVVGPMNSSTVLSALPVYEEAKLAMITQSATNDNRPRAAGPYSTASARPTPCRDRLLPSS